MTQNNNSSVASEIVVDGLAEATQKQALAERLAALKAAKKKADKEAAKLEAWKQRTAERNPACLVDTVRSVPVGEAVDNGDGETLISKGRVVEIECETCGKHRLVNVQDAFQVRFCSEHKAEARKAKAKARRDGKKVAELSKLDEAELERQIAELEAAGVQAA